MSRKLRSIVFVLSAILVFLSEAAFAQVQKNITLKCDNVTLRDFFNQVEEESGYSLAYNNSEIDLSQRISVNVSDKDVLSVMTSALRKFNISVHQDGNRLVLTHAEPEPETAKTTTKQKSSTITAKGKVVDTSGEPIIGAYVVEQGSTTNGAITDMDGLFTLVVPSGATVEVTSLGFKKVITGANTSMDIVMSSDTEFLNEAIVVGYGIQKVATLTGSVSQVKSEKLNTAPVQNVTNALAGQLPGLISKQTSGLPGQDGASLSVRGFGAPLVIIDGIEGDISQLDAGQIESVSILKDGSGSIYGARAGNGVILVTTKRGSDIKPSIIVNSSVSMQGNVVTTRPADSYERALLQNDRYVNRGNSRSRAPFSEKELQKFIDGSDPDYGNYDWWSEVVRPLSPQYNTSVSLTGGSERINYYGYAGYNRQETQFKTNGGNYDRYNFQLNINTRITDHISAGMNIQYMKDIKKYPSGGALINDGNDFWSMMYNADTRYPCYLPDRSYLATANSVQGSPIWGTNMDNSGYYQVNRDNMKVTGNVEYKFHFVKGLKAKANVMYTSDNKFHKEMHKHGVFYTYISGEEAYRKMGETTSPSMLTESHAKSSNIVQQYSLNYNGEFGKHNLEALFMYETTFSQYNDLSTKRSDFESTVIEEMTSGDPTTASNESHTSNYGRRSFITRINYNYASRYLLEVTLRADASSRFAKKYRWGCFPSVSAGWNIAREDFASGWGALDNLKLRASFGMSGYDQVADFNYVTGYIYNSYYTIGEKLYHGIISNGLANELLSWEDMNIYNIGLDFDFWGRRLYGELDLFQRDRNGIPGYRTQSLPTTFGEKLPQENLNSQRSRGFEFRIGTSDSLDCGLNYDISANISYSRTKWVYYDQAEEIDPDRKRLYVKSGEYVDRQIGYISEGLFATKEEVDAWGKTAECTGFDNSVFAPGDVKIKDLNGDNVIDWRDQTTIGKGSTPHWMAGLNANLEWKGLDVSVLFQGAWGYTTPIDYPEFSKIYCSLYYDESHNPDPDALVCRPSGASTNYLVSDFNYKNTAYLRLKNAAIGYSLPKSALNKIHLQKLRFYIAGTNLLTLSNIKKYGADPEIGGSIGTSYPQQFTVSLGVNLVL